MNKHTPGPWKCIETEFGNYQTGEVAFVISSETEQMISSVANCRIIAAAPELLAVLEEITNGMEQVAEAIPEAMRYMPGLEWMPKKAREVIKKATEGV